MLKYTRIQRYKSLFDVSVDLEPLTVFIGPNGSGKSSYCEALQLSYMVEHLHGKHQVKKTGADGVMRDMAHVQINSHVASQVKGKESSSFFSNGDLNKPISFEYEGELATPSFYDFIPSNISMQTDELMSCSGVGVANSLTKILFDDRDKFTELEARFVSLVPNMSRMKFVQDDKRNSLLFLVDRYSDFAIPAERASDGTLRILAFLTALYDVSQPGIICFEEPENGIHPWLLNKLMQLLQTVSIEGISGKPAQIIITTHSPVLLNYVKPEQIRAVELDDKGQTKISALPVETKRFQAAMDAYDGELGELWFTNIFGGNPE